MINGMKPNYIKQKEFKDALTVFCSKLTEDSKDYISRFEFIKDVVFKPSGGRKYVKVKYFETRSQTDYESGEVKILPDLKGSIHCFVEVETGNVFKPAGWRAPYTKGNNAVRANIFDETTFEKTDMHGGWLYL